MQSFCIILLVIFRMFSFFSFFPFFFFFFFHITNLNLCHLYEIAEDAGTFSLSTEGDSWRRFENAGNILKIVDSGNFDPLTCGPAVGSWIRMDNLG